jgi:hypothetical protein
MRFPVARVVAIALGLLLAALVWSAGGAHAQQVEWREQRTDSFAILYPAGSETEAAEYARFVDDVYEEVSAVFAYRTPPPVVLRIYPSMELYEQINPLAAQIPGVVAHAHTGRREISIALPQTAGQSPDQIVNNVRHELTHIIAADLSGDKLTTAWQEGIAQYIEHPSAELDNKMQLMQQVIAAGRVLPWSRLNQPGVAYSDPQISYPQSYTMVAFLIERDGFATFKRFIELTETSSGYRGALEAAYNVSADQLEREWAAQLEAFVAGAYRNRGAGAFDLSQAEALVARGEYESAIGQLEGALATLGTEPSPLQAQTQALLDRAWQGQRATQLAADARTALERGEYEVAQRAAQEGREMLNQLGQPAQMQVMDEYVALARRGIAAQEQLVEARAALQQLRVGEAQTLLTTAYGTFTQLGDEGRAAAAQTTLRSIRRTELWTAVGLVVAAALLLGINVQRRLNGRERAIPFS